MRCEICREEVRDRREHRHDQHRIAENYGRLKAEQEREWMRTLVRREELDREIQSENHAIRSLENRP